jgi:hypothetical protein
MRRLRPVAVLALLALAGPVAAQQQPSAEELAKLAQNPVANLISIPFQNNTNFNYGPRVLRFQIQLMLPKSVL